MLLSEELMSAAVAFSPDPRVDGTARDCASPKVIDFRAFDDQGCLRQGDVVISGPGSHE